ncbi:MAG: endolytic transglycosylase MltG [Pseudomonadota bacterium]|nr:MAG: endolytic transglycosylase MltG [Pseudomonadota bacterium]
MRLLIYKFLVLAALVGGVALGGFWLDYRSFMQTPLNVGPKGLDYVVPSGSNLTRIARDLEQRGVLDRPRYLVWHARLHGNANLLKTGEYHIASDTAPEQLLGQFVRGQVIQYALTIVEGWNFRQVMDAVQSSEYLEHQLAGLDDAAVMARLGRSDVHPEGRFLPDTYHFPRGTSDVEFLQRAYAAMESELAAAWEDRAAGLPLKTPEEVLIMASIVEKETGLASERGAIAGVFVRRLMKNMRLQSDPTVIYGMGDAYQGNIRRRDLQTDTPYNTYRRRGLPPTPIAMPGRDAIRATANPKEGNALYFVSRGDGSHYFSATLEEHNEAVIKYQLKGRKKSFSSFDAKKDAAKQ